MFGSFTAVREINLSVQAGEFITLLGPSGCGKTTLLRMISGFERPTEGSVHLDGAEVTDLPPNKRDVNQVFQSYALFPHLNVHDNIAFGLRVKKVARREIKERVAEAVAMVALSGMERRKPEQLSGGQKQRVALARALVNRPKVLLLDEPLAALDAELRRSMQLELKSLQRLLGITFVFVTHDQDEALSMSDRIAVMNHGWIEQIDSAETIYHRPATRFVARFIGEGNVWDCATEPGQVRLPGGDVLKVDDVKDATAVSIRPEAVGVSAMPSDLPATVIERIFRGSSDLLQLRTSAGLSVRAVTTANRWKRGDAIFLQIDSKDVVLLRE